MSSAADQEMVNTIIFDTIAPADRSNCLRTREYDYTSQGGGCMSQGEEGKSLEKRKRESKLLYCALILGDRVYQREAKRQDFLAIRRKNTLLECALMFVKSKHVKAGNEGHALQRCGAEVR